MKQEVCSPDQPEVYSLSEGSGCDPPTRPVGPFWGGVSGREPPPGVSPPALPADPLVLPRLCCALCALPPGGPFPALHCPPRTVSLFWILLAATGQAGDTGITRPSPQPVSCPRPALLL